jgi:hypothetical protein
MGDPTPSSVSFQQPRNAMFAASNIRPHSVQSFAPSVLNLPRSKKMLVVASLRALNLISKFCFPLLGARNFSGAVVGPIAL